MVNLPDISYPGNDRYKIELAPSASSTLQNGLQQMGYQNYPGHSRDKFLVVKRFKI